MTRIAIIAAAMLALAWGAEAAPRAEQRHGLRTQPPAMAMVVDARAAERDARQLAQRQPRITGLGRPVGRPYQP